MVQKWHVHGAMCAAGWAAAIAVGQQAGFSVKDGGPSGLPGSGVYEEGGVGPPTQVGGEGGMGLNSQNDELDAASADQEEEDFLLCVSADTEARGVPLTIRIPTINLADQASKNQQAADSFISTEAWNFPGGIIGPPVSLGLFNNVLGRNQSAPYVNAWGLQPPVGPDVELPEDQQDDIDALTMLTPSAQRSGAIELFFSVSRQSPSLTSLGGTSGADVFYDPDINTGGDEVVYASFAELGLDQFDELDALVVFDRGGDRRGDRLYDPEKDVVFFSLAVQSPTLDVLGARPGDVLVRTPTQVQIFANSAQFGFADRDELDGLVFDRLMGTAERTIDLLVPPCSPDWNGDGDVNSSDFLAYLNDYVQNKARADLFPPPDGDGVLNSSDFLEYLRIFIEGCA